MVEIRAMSASGAGAWCRVGEPICTALVAQEPQEIQELSRHIKALNTKELI